MQVGIEDATVAIMTIRDPGQQCHIITCVPGSGGLALKQLTFDWKVADKYQELCNFEMQVKNIFS